MLTLELRGIFIGVLARHPFRGWVDLLSELGLRVAFG